MHKHKSLRLVNWGRVEFESTPAFKEEVNSINNEVRALYDKALSNEKNFFKKIWLRIKIKIEIRRRIQLVSSSRNLHALNQYSWLFIAS